MSRLRDGRRLDGWRAKKGSWQQRRPWASIRRLFPWTAIPDGERSTSQTVYRVRIRPRSWKAQIMRSAAPRIAWKDRLVFSSDILILFGSYFDL